MDARPVSGYGTSLHGHDGKDMVSCAGVYEGKMLIRGLLVGAAAGAYFGLSGYMANQMSRVPRTYPETTPDSLGLQYEDAVFHNRGGSLELRGWLVWEGSPESWVILVHGSGGNRAHNAVNMLGLTRDLVRRGIGVFTFDLRAHGRSQGSRVSVGFKERTDLQGAIDYLEARGVPRDRIGALGFSLGAVISIMAASEERGLAGLVLDSPFASPMEMAQQTTRRRGIPSFLLPGMMLMGRVLYGVDLSLVRPLEAVKSVDCPLLLIHGSEDIMVDPSHSERLYDAAEGDKELWLVPEARHAQGYNTRPAEYVDRVAAFFDRARQRPQPAGLP